MAPGCCCLSGVVNYRVMQNNTHKNESNDSPKRRRLNGLIVILLVIAGLIILNYKPAIDRIHCNEEIINSIPEVIMLGTWWCRYCYQARRYFTDNNISYCEYDIEHSAEGEKLFNDVNGQVVPVLLIEQYIISGFDETRLEHLLNKVREKS